MASSPPCRLLGLPLELLYLIAEDGVLKVEDLKNLRLAHKVLATAFTPVLFSRVVLDFGSFRQRNAVKDEIKRHISVLRNQYFSYEFYNAVRTFIIDASNIRSLNNDTCGGEKSKGPHFAQYFASQKNSSDHFAQWFPGLKYVILKVNAKGQAKVASKLIKGILNYQQTPGTTIKHILKLEGINTHRNCLQQIKNVHELHIHADPSKPEQFLLDLGSSIAASPLLTSLSLNLWDGAGPIRRANHPVNFNALLSKVPAEKLRNLKGLEFGFNVMTPDASQLHKLVNLEDLSFEGYFLPDQLPRWGPWRDVNPQETIWDHLSTTGPHLKNLSVNMIDSSLLSYLAVRGDQITSLSINVTSYKGTIKEARSLISTFWHTVLPKLHGNLKHLAVTSAVCDNCIGRDVRLILEIPYADSGHIGQHLANLEEVTLGFVYQKGSVSKVLSLIQHRPDQQLQRITLQVKLPDVESYSTRKGAFNVQGWKRAILHEVETGKTAPRDLANGIILNTDIYFKTDMDVPWGSAKWVARSKKWQKLG